MSDGRCCIEVAVCINQKRTVCKLLLVDNIVEPKSLYFAPLELNEQDKPAEDALLLEAASFILAYGAKVYEECIVQWREDDLNDAGIVDKLCFHLMGEHNPWAGYLHVRGLPLVEGEPNLDNTASGEFIGILWRFMDGSDVYLTPQGPMTPDQFQIYLVEELQISVMDAEWDVPMVSVAMH